MASERDKVSTSSESQSEGLRGNKCESKLDLRSSDDLRSRKLDRNQEKRSQLRFSPRDPFRTQGTASKNLRTIRWTPLTSSTSCGVDESDESQSRLKNSVPGDIE